MFGILLRKEHVLEIESLVLKSLNEIDKELTSTSLTDILRIKLLRKKAILNEVYTRLPL